MKGKHSVWLVMTCSMKSNTSIVNHFTYSAYPAALVISNAENTAATVYYDDKMQPSNKANAFYTMNKKDWIDQENKEFRDATEREFKNYYLKYKKLFKSSTGYKKSMKIKK